MDEMARLDAIFDAVVAGQQKVAVAEAAAALGEGVAAGEILHGACIPAMDEVGCQFEEGERFVPEMLLSARTMAAVVDLLRPHLVTAGEASLGTFVIGTVAGDVHDIGKNLVGMMMEGAGFQVVDLGTDVPAQRFVEAVQEHRPVLLGLSALLTTTMPAVGATIGALRAAGLRDRVKIIVGGAPTSPEFAHRIGADAYAADAGSAPRVAKALLGLG